MKRAILLAVVCALAGCSKGTTNRVEEPNIENAVTEYDRGLTDGTFNGFLAHDQSFQNTLLLAHAGIPDAAWPANMEQLRASRRATIQQERDTVAFGQSQSACYLIIRQGGHISPPRISQVNDGSWQVNFSVSYDNPASSPVVLTTSGKTRRLRSANVTVMFLRAAADKDSLTKTKIVAAPNCTADENSFATFAVPPLDMQAAIHLSQQGGNLPSQYVASINSITGVSSDQNWQNWQQFLAAAAILKASLEQHGWTVSGFQPQSMYYYDIHGAIAPPSGTQQWIVGSFVMNGWGGGNGYRVVLLDHSNATATAFNVQDDTATATIAVHFEGCTPFCALWKDMHGLPFDLGRYVFADWNAWHDPALASLDNVNSIVVQNYAWDAFRGWHLA